MAVPRRVLAAALFVAVGALDPDEQSEDVKVSEEVEEEPKEIVTDKVEEGEERAEEKVDSIDE